MRDIVIIGGGPGGYVAAIRGAQLGATVTLIEGDRVGGTCLNRGCIPTKALYKQAEVMNTLAHSDSYGIHVEGYAMDVSAVQNRKENIVERLVGGIEQLLQANKIEVISGIGRIKSSECVQVEKQDGTIEEVPCKHIVIATGSVPDSLPIEGMDYEGVWNSNDILEFTEVPKRLAIIGGGVVGMEFASIFNSFGAQVTVLEYLPRILSSVDASISKRLKSLAKKKGIHITTGAEVQAITKIDGGYEVGYGTKKKDEAIEVDRVFVAAGRIANVASLNLDQIGVDYHRKSIKVDEHYETNVAGIYAIGDVNGISMLAHAASHQGVQVINHIMGEEIEETSIVPSCIFVFPEIAVVGMTEEEAKEQEVPILVGKFMFSANGKALTLGEEEGFVKIVAHEETHEVLGMHILGPHGSDLIHEGALAIQNKLKLEDIIHTIHAHPTLGEAIHEASLDALGIGIHSMPKRKK